MCVRRIGCAMVALIISAGAGCAADLPLIARKAPVLRASYDWTGFYAGAHVGAGFSYRNWTLVEGSTTEAGDAVMLGGQLGYNMQFGRWVTGIEADGSWGNLKDESLCPDGPNTCWTKQKWLSTVVLFQRRCCIH
jgi:outer membrane immunogenic protein